TGRKALYADHMNAEAVELNFRTMFDQLFGSGPLPASLKSVHCDSFEVYGADWTPKLLDEFRRRRGYDPTPWLPTLESGNIETRALTARFLDDFNRTRSDCFLDSHYRLVADLAHKRGIGWQTEAGGPRVLASDSLQMLGTNDIPVGEFWMECPTHRVTPEERFYVKAPATAAHIYGKRFVAAEAFTSIGNHWEEDPWSLKPLADQAFLEGVNRMVLHTFSSSPDEFGKPGAVYFAGTHINPNITWWDQSHAWFDYLSRCQHLLSQGLFVADVLFFNGDRVPNYVQMKHVDPRLGLGYDYDVANAEVLLTRTSVRNGRIVLPDGMSYRLLVLPEQKSMSLEVLKKIGELVDAGATVIGAPPTTATGLADYRARDAEVKRLAAGIWAGGKVLQNRLIRDVLRSLETPPDFIANAGLDYLHRRDGDTDIYFVVNKLNREQSIEARFRVAGKTPELWDPATGAHRIQPVFHTDGAHTVVPLRLAARESVFVVFRTPPVPDPVVSLTPSAELFASDSGDLQLRAAAPGLDCALHPRLGSPRQGEFRETGFLDRPPRSGHPLLLGSCYV
ncbi:MAG: glycosyl hydrolase, partial [Acidobacteria bacterium]|nr:glycosyl hydrolase [Acidobacteriota bacterium]